MLFRSFRFDYPVDEIMRATTARSILPGVNLEEEYPELENCLLVCATETKTEQDIKSFTELLQKIFTRLQTTRCPVEPKMA